MGVDYKGLNILVIDPSMDPEKSPTENEISDVVDFLSKDHNVDLVWSLTKHQFKNFDSFKEEAIKERTQRINLRKERYFDSYEELPPYDFLRKEPITGVEDLKGYDIIFYHFSVENSDMLIKLRKNNPEIPIVQVIFDITYLRENKKLGTDYELNTRGYYILYKLEGVGSLICQAMREKKAFLNAKVNS